MFDNRCSHCGIDLSQCFPEGTVVHDIKRDAKGVVVSWSDSDSDQFRFTVEYDNASINTSHFESIDITRRFRVVDDNTPNTQSPSQSLERPLYAIKDGNQWFGTDEQLNVMTGSYTTLKALRQDFGASTSKGVGTDEDGNKIYQLILEPLE